MTRVPCVGCLAPLLAHCHLYGCFLAVRADEPCVEREPPPRAPTDDDHDLARFDDDGGPAPD